MAGQYTDTQGDVDAVLRVPYLRRPLQESFQSRSGIDGTAVDEYFDTSSRGASPSPRSDHNRGRNGPGFSHSNPKSVVISMDKCHLVWLHVAFAKIAQELLGNKKWARLLQKFLADSLSDFSDQGVLMLKYTESEEINLASALYAELDRRMLMSTSLLHIGQAAMPAASAWTPGTEVN